MTRVLILAGFAGSLTNFRGKLIEEMRARGYDVHAAAPGLAADEQTCAWLRERGVTCHDVPLDRAGLSISQDLRTFRALIALCNLVRPDHFLGYTVKPVIWGLLAAKRAGVRNRVALITGLGYAFTGEGSGRRRLIGKLTRMLYWYALKQSTLIIFQNPDDRNHFRDIGLLPHRTPVEIVNGSGVDLSTFQVEKIPQGPTRFLLIARLLGDKGIREYVSAARKVRARWPDVQCYLVGGRDPNPDGIPEEEVCAWHDAGDVIWRGALHDVRPEIAQAHVYVLPSYREGTPRTVLEAMAMGRAVITTDAPGCRQTVQSGRNGFLVPVRDVPALADAMERFLLDPTLIPEMGAEARRVAEARYDVHLVNAAMLEAMNLA